MYNEAAVLDLFLSSVMGTLHQINEQIDLQVLVLDNGSKDNSLEIIRGWDWENLEVCCVSFTRNFGYENSIWFGLFVSEADAFTFLDSDGEDPVELLLEFIEAINQGSYAAIGIRLKRYEGRLLQSARKISYALLAKISDAPFTPNAGNFMMIRREVARGINSERNSFPLLRASVSKSGFEASYFPYNRSKRMGGESKFSKLNFAKFGVAAFLTTTTWPLRFAAYNSLASLGLLFLAFFLKGAFGFDIIQRLNFQFFMNVVILVNVASISLYLARVYRNGISSSSDIVQVDQNRSFFTSGFKFASSFRARN